MHASLNIQSAALEARQTDGLLTFYSQHGEIARLTGYDLSFGCIHNVRRPIENDWIHVDDIQELKVGDVIELRNEYQFARANFPLTHVCCIVEIVGTSIRVDRPPSNPKLQSQQGTFVLKADHIHIGNFVCDANALDLKKNSCRLSATTSVVDLVLTVEIDGCSSVLLRISRTFHRSIRVLNEKIVFDQLPPLKEVYRKNRQLDLSQFQRRYNLANEGACFLSEFDEGFFIYLPGDLSSIDIEKPALRFELGEITKFRAEPHDLQAVLHGDIYRYASARCESGEVRFMARFPDTTGVLGITILWYRNSATAIGIEALVGGQWTFVYHHELGDPSQERFEFSRLVLTSALRITLSVEENVGIRAIDFFGDGKGFELSLNLDDHRDHRHYRYLSPDRRSAEMGQMVMEMRSPSVRSSGETVTQKSRLRIGSMPTIRPRLMHTPHGAQALLLWTEHADRASLESHRATMFGRSDIICAKDAVGGFEFHGIRITKSVFWANPTSQMCSKSYMVPQVALADNVEFLNMCRDIARRGHEICVHSPWPTNAPPAACHEALKEFHKEFYPVTWIDHSSRVVHCGLSSQGMNQDSPYFLGDVWKRLGYRFFWQFASEDAAEQRVGSINTQQLRFGDWCHTPLYWRHPTETGDFLSWATIRGGDLDVYTNQAIEELVSQWGVCITHTYPPAHYDDASRNQYITRQEDGVFTTSELFEDVLARFGRHISSGRLAALTVREAMTYWEALEKVDLSFDENGTSITNNGPQTIAGFSFALRGALRAADPMRLRIEGADTIATLDLPPGATVRLLAASKMCEASLLEVFKP